MNNNSTNTALTTQTQPLTKQQINLTVKLKTLAENKAKIEKAKEIITKKFAKKWALLTKDAKKYETQLTQIKQQSQTVAKEISDLRYSSHQYFFDFYRTLGRMKEFFDWDRQIEQDIILDLSQVEKINQLFLKIKELQNNSVNLNLMEKQTQQKINQILQPKQDAINEFNSIKKATMNNINDELDKVDFDMERTKKALIKANFPMDLTQYTNGLLKWATELTMDKVGVAETNERKE